ncbi:hypothetical protein NE604_02660 [Anaerofustis stercorihominis]|uniref:Uncharacterized protein n=1 Tax=Anaerofustis stercorihominis DSM 17244 TaxID=445971 RepID=B1C8A4_9FIRM|nr:hypothetical protein [Anaerofustis stercorihominis]EDS73241.1 hypothetical protein ANASTE_00961 [Anaerofustis stercorihominis DSM 17244]MCQ4794539.1 hypothetical protein [Anaerofustis stercorihominis]
MKPNIKKYLPFIIIGIVLVLFLLITPGFSKKIMLNSVMENQVLNKEITKVEYISYEDKPFMSVVKEKREINGKDSTAAKFIKNMGNYKIKVLSNKDYTKEIFYVHFKDGSKLICYIDKAESKIGVDSGKVWIKDIKADNIIKEMKEVQLVKEVK